jgi:hypothetical protein
MNRDRETDRRLRAWLEEGADEAPEAIVWAALDDVERVPQRRAWVAALDGLLLRLRPAAGVASIAAVVMLALGAYLFFGPRNLGDISPTPPPLTLDDLPAIVLWDDTAPRGWTLDNLVSNPHEVMTIPFRSMGGTELDALEEPRGYVGGRYTDFTGPGAAYMSWAALFEDAPDAEAALATYLNEMESSDAWGLGPGQPARLGDEGMVYTGETRRFLSDIAAGDPVPTQIYLWRVGNLLLATGGWFEYEPDELRAVAEGMDARAR